MRPVAIVACGLFIATIALLAFFFRGEAPTPSSPIVAAPAGPVESIVESEPAAASSMRRPVASQAPPAKHAAIERFEEVTRYPSSSRRLTEDAVDLLNPDMRHERRMPIPDLDNNDELAWEVRYTADRYFVRGTEPLELSLELWHDDEPVIPTKVELIAEPVAGGDTAERVRLPTRLSGNQINARFVADEHWPDYLGQARVTAVFEADGLAEQTGYVSFYFTPEEKIPARFTGQFADDVRAGDLVIDVGVEVDVAGRYHIEGNLFDADDRPVGWARYAGELALGAQAAPLRFYGLIFHDADAWAPFTLRQVRGYRVRLGDAPHREDMPNYDGAYLTADQYALADFRSREHDSPHKQRMLEMYRDALRRGVRLTDPGLAGGQRR